MRGSIQRHILSTKGHCRTLLCSVLSLLSSPVGAELASTARLYRTPEEHREVGIERRITPWLTSAMLAEVEWKRQQFRLRASSHEERAHVMDELLQLGLEARLASFAHAEVVIQYDSDTGDVDADEAVLALHADHLELEAGRTYLPFGRFYSHFVSGPLVEFGETQANALVLSYAPAPELDLQVASFKAQGRDGERNVTPWGYVLAIEFKPRVGFHLGWSVLSDLAAANSRLLSGAMNRGTVAEENLRPRIVPGMSAYIAWLSAHFDFSIEAVTALRNFRELEADRNRPLAWNIELAHHLTPSFDLALRVAGSRELEDAPQIQYGIAGSWRACRNLSLTVEYLRGDFSGDLAGNAHDEASRRVDQVGLNLSIAF